MIDWIVMNPTLSYGLVGAVVGLLIGLRFIWCYALWNDMHPDYRDGIVILLVAVLWPVFLIVLLIDGSEELAARLRRQR